ncbi:PoNi-like cognate immunity protein [Pelomonas sp. Root405]|uniref:PoNi-like cognate immunity protein n=1 Tax=Pelomonas sp. Root405 TaxID=1736529 RepID=UPI00191120F4|nr:PoNi-like cognate immunity protein [Pelomonas sp. Root405]
MKRDQLFSEERLQALLSIFSEVVAKSEKALEVPAVNKRYEPTFVWRCAWEQLDLLLLRYSTGHLVAGLKPHLLRLLDLWERSEEKAAALWSEAEREPRRRWAGNISFYNRCFWLVGLALALELEDAPWQRLLKLIGNEGQDALLDRVIATRQPGRPVGTVLCHPKPYARLLAVLDGAKDRQAALLRDFVSHWYAELDRAPRKGMSRLTNLEERPDWYDNHEGVSSYFGYWCVEAVAVAKAFDIDDSLCLGHPHYPGDLLRPDGPSTHPAGEAPKVHAAVPAAKPGLLQRLRRTF